MKIPIIKYSDRFLNILGIFMRIGGITIWPFIILREKYTLNWNLRKARRIINHETIHIKQQQELLIIPFYILYVTEWFVKLFIYGKKAYYNISFEREAYDNDDNLNYLDSRRNYSWIRRIFK